MYHIEYYMTYTDLPDVYRNEANPTFHETIGDTVVMSALSRKYLKKLCLISLDRSHQYESDISFLVKKALDKVAFLPFSYVLDKWRWEAFRQNISNSDYTRSWWKMRFQYQGILPSAVRTEREISIQVRSITWYQIYHTSGISSPRCCNIRSMKACADWLETVSHCISVTSTGRRKSDTDYCCHWCAKV